MTPTDLAVLFHETYERLAPTFGYATREETRQFDENSPNGRLMIAVCREIMERTQGVVIFESEKFIPHWQIHVVSNPPELVRTIDSGNTRWYPGEE